MAKSEVEVKKQACSRSLCISASCRDWMTPSGRFPTTLFSSGFHLSRWSHSVSRLRVDVRALDGHGERDDEQLAHHAGLADPRTDEPAAAAAHEAASRPEGQTVLSRPGYDHELT